jgi:hypothetical protein
MLLVIALTSRCVASREGEWNLVHFLIGGCVANREADSSLDPIHGYEYMANFA